MDATILVAVVGARLLVPLLIFRYPLPAIVACLVIDGVDQTVFQTFTELPLDGYQSYDKALDIYYLCLAYIATLRTWTNLDAVRIARFLLYYRLLGTIAFEASDGVRALLLVFPNTFEYFFIAYEIVRLRWDPAPITRRTWLLTAAGIWILIKLPQEWWIHIARLDVTDEVQANPGITAALVIVVVALAGVAWVVLGPRLAPADHPWRVAADPVPARFSTPRARAQVRALRSVLDLTLAERVVLISAISTIFALILPGVEVSALRLTAAVTVVVLVNAVVGRALARRGVALRNAATEFAALAIFNLAVVGVSEVLVGRDLQAAAAVFFVLLLTLVVVAYSWCRPVYELRRDQAAQMTQGGLAPANG